MEFIFGNQQFEETEVFNMPSTSLAFVGDAFFTLYARMKVLNVRSKSGKLHSKATELVNAHSQGEFLSKLTEHITEREQNIVQRARNTWTASKSKNACLADYKKSTAFEALLGYLFLTKQFDRMQKMMRIIFDDSNTEQLSESKKLTKSEDLQKVKACKK